MQEILYEYQMNATTWVYLSSLIMIAVYFKFRRFWSVRNLDLVGLILFAPGLLLVLHGQELQSHAARLSADEKAAAHDAKESGSQPPAPAGEPSQTVPVGKTADDGGQFLR